MCSDLPPLEIWADGIEEYIFWESGGYHVKPGVPDWAREKLEEYKKLLDEEPGDNGMVIYINTVCPNS